MRRAPAIVVIGAGIVGASVAYHLAARGGLVTLIDKGQPGADCTAKSFGWIGDQPSPLRNVAVGEYHRLLDELQPALNVKWTGALIWSADPTETERIARERLAAGLDVRLLGRDEIAKLEPNLRRPPEVAALETSDGAAEPLEMTQVLVCAAEERGARLLLNAGDASLQTTHSRVTGVRVGSDVIPADIVVITAGTGTTQLLAPLGLSLPVEPSPATITRLVTPKPLVNTIIASYDREFRQVSPTMMISPEEVTDTDLQAVAERAISDIGAMLVGGDNVQLRGVEIGWRPMPVDGDPIIGHMPGIQGLYVTVMHSGVTLAAVAGRLTAVELIEDVSVTLLAPYRPARFSPTSASGR